AIACSSDAFDELRDRFRRDLEPATGPVGVDVRLTIFISAAFDFFVATDTPEGLPFKVLTKIRMRHAPQRHCNTSDQRVCPRTSFGSASNTIDASRRVLQPKTA